MKKILLSVLLNHEKNGAVFIVGFPPNFLGYLRPAFPAYIFTIQPVYGRTNTPEASTFFIHPVLRRSVAHVFFIQQPWHCWHKSYALLGAFVCARFMFNLFISAQQSRAKKKERYKIIYMKFNPKLGFCYNLGVLIISGLL